MTTILICLVAVALLAATKVLKEDRKTLGWVSGLLVGLMVLLIVLRFTACSTAEPPSADVTVDRYWAVGWRLGMAVSEDLPGGGKLVVLQPEPGSDVLARVADSQLAGLKEGLSEDVFEIITRRPGFLRGLEPDMSGAGGRGGPSKEDVSELKEAAAIVSFAQLPVSPRMKSTFPPIYLLDDFGSGYWIAAMKAGVVRAAVTTHRDSSKINFSLESGTPQERFDAVYQLFTPENVETFK